MKIYRGARHPRQCAVSVEVVGKPGRRGLNMRQDIRNHSPTGAEWGYGGSGPAQLALAILADHFGDEEKALAHYQDFKRDVIAGFDKDTWQLTTDQINEALNKEKTA